MSRQIKDTTSLDELYDDPTAFGLPTFDEFRKNPDKYMGREDDRLAEVDYGSRNLGKHVQRHVYEIEGYRCKSLEEVERIAKSQGIELKELDYVPVVTPLGGGQCDLKITFMRREKVAARNQPRKVLRG